MAIDVVLLQLGTPAAPTARALRPYLREFLSDPRVIEAPAFVRWLLVHLIIVPFRAPRSAAKYRRIWDPSTGSPLLHITQLQATALQAALGERFKVHIAMRYGEPSIGRAVAALGGNNCRRLIALTMYPQYSATTTASAMDGLFAALRTARVLPDLRIITDYHDDPGYIEAVAVGIERSMKNSTNKSWDARLLSFHGIPRAYIDRGDPYRARCETSARLIARRLGWHEEEWRITFQSRLGPSDWLEPYTDQVLRELGERGTARVLVAQPGFTADCLETIDEIGREGRDEFVRAGGGELVRVPCVNDDPAWIAALAGLVEREATGW